MLDIYTQWHEALFDFQRIPFALSAIILTMIVGLVIGPLAGNANSLLSALISKVFGVFGDRLDRLSRKKGDLIFRGFVLTAFCVVILAVIGEFVQNIAINGGFIEVLCVSVAISSGSVWYALLKLYFALEKKELNTGAYYAISRSTRIDLTSVDDFGITRAGMSYAARSFDKSLVAPVFWYLVGGLPILFIYSALSALSWRFGKDGFTKGFGEVPLALEKLMGVIPSLFSAMLVTMASSFTPTAKLHKGIASWIEKGEGRAPYAQGGFPLTALAWALSVNIGGPSKDLGASTIKSAWVGPKGSSAKLNHAHLKRAIYINVIAHLLFICALLISYVFGVKS